MSVDGQPIFEIANKMHVPIELILKWVKNKTRIMKQTKLPVPRKAPTRRGKQPAVESETCPIQKKRVVQRLDNYEMPAPIASEKHYVEQDEPLQEGEEPFIFEYDVPYRRKAMVKGQLRDIIGIVPSPIERIVVNDLFSDEYITMKPDEPRAKRCPCKRKPKGVASEYEDMLLEILNEESSGD